MLWYNRLYVGNNAKKHRFSIIQNIRQKKYRPGIYVLTPASNGNNILDIHPVLSFASPLYKEDEDMLIVGIADGYQDALELAGTIVGEMYEKTGAFCLEEFLKQEQ